MPQIGTPEHPLRVAIIGAGPAGFYTAEHLFRAADAVIEVDMFDRLPTPYGLVRAGVAPDHEKIKNVTRKFDATASNERFRFFGNVDVGTRIDVDVLKRFYHQIVYATGAQVDRRLGIDGEDLSGSHSATDFVAWYNGHPDYRELQFDLSAESVLIIGVGNVAVDVARILCRTPAELETTDIADYALAQLAESGVRTVYMVGRRGPAQAAFTNPEIKELGELQDATTEIAARDLELDPLSRKHLDENPDRALSKKLEIMQGLVAPPAALKSKRLIVRFLQSPVRFIAGEGGRLAAAELVRNTLVEGRGGRLSARPTDETEIIDVGLAFRSVGYRGVPVPGVPFREDWGTIPNDRGRIVDGVGGTVRPGEYAAGWIKRGPTGVIGTNKADALETVEVMLEDIQRGALLVPSSPDRESSSAHIARAQPDYFSYDDWKRLDTIETERGAALGRPRLKFTSREEMIGALR
jgi:ferredoxin--NADP+ reductase